MYKIKRGSVLYFRQISHIYNKYFITEFGKYNTNLLYEFVNLILNDILRLFGINFFETYCLFKGQKIVGVRSYRVLSGDANVAENGICLVPEERGKGLAKKFCKNLLKILRKEGRKGLFVLESRPSEKIFEGTAGIKDFFYHFTLEKKMLRNGLEKNPKKLELSKYKIADFKDVRIMIKGCVGNNYNFFTERLIRPYSDCAENMSDKIFSFLGHSHVWRFVARFDGKVIGYSEVIYCKRLKEIFIFIIYDKKIKEYGFTFIKEINDRLEKIKKVNVHIFVKSNVEDSFISSEFEKYGIVPTKLYIKYLKLD